MKISFVSENLLADCNNAEKANEFWQNTIKPETDPYKESVVILIVNVKWQIIDWNLVSIGSIAECMCNPADVIRPILLLGGVGGILIHNHPSGDCNPSNADSRLTRQLNDCFRLMKLRLCDHLICTHLNNSYFSFAENGLM